MRETRARRYHSAAAAHGWDMLKKVGLAFSTIHMQKQSGWEPDLLFTWLRGKYSDSVVLVFLPWTSTCSCSGFSSYPDWVRGGIVNMCDEEWLISHQWWLNVEGKCLWPFERFRVNTLNSLKKVFEIFHVSPLWRSCRREIKGDSEALVIIMMNIRFDLCWWILYCFKQQLNY